MIPVYIPSFNRAESIKTHLWLEASAIDYRILLHSDKCADSYIKAGRVNSKKIIVTGAPFGVTNHRNWIVDNLAKRGAWYVSLDDNIESMKRVVDEHYDKKKVDVDDPRINQATFAQEVEASEYMRLLEKDIAVADSIHAEYIGYATVDNYYFNSKKYKAVGYVISKACAIKFAGLRYDPALEAMEDFGYCASQLVKNNCVLINSWIKPIAGHYEIGGIGTYERRLPRKIIDCEYLIEKYPELFRYKVKKGCHPKAELQFRFHSPKQIIEWKRKHNITND